MIRHIISNTGREFQIYCYLERICDRVAFSPQPTSGNTTKIIYIGYIGKINLQNNYDLSMPFFAVRSSVFISYLPILFCRFPAACYYSISPHNIAAGSEADDRQRLAKRFILSDDLGVMQTTEQKFVYIAYLLKNGLVFRQM